MENIFISSDHHFYHSNIIKFCDRPFENADEMNRILIENWNKTVGNNDTVYYLGDLSWGNFQKTKEILDQLNGKIIFINGNHDQIIRKDDLKKRFLYVTDYKELYLDNKTMLVLFHYPISSWNKKPHGSIHLHGHTHGNYAPEKGLILDVGIDGVLCKSKNPETYRPLKITEIMDYMKTREIEKYD